MPTTELSVQRSVVVDVPIDEAFRLFTDRFDTWWPRTHHIGGADLDRAVLECRQGGRWYEIDVDGSECEWGKVLVWEPPHRLVIAWQIDIEWKYDPNLVTEVDVRFRAESPSKTRVELEHRDLERFGEAMEQARETFESDGGWQGILNAFKASTAT